jgi:hypothetical protein
MSKLKSNIKNNNNNSNYYVQDENKLEFIKLSSFESKNLNNNNISKEINNNKNKDSVSFSTNESQTPFQLGKYLKLPVSTGEDNKSHSNKLARSKSVKDTSINFVMSTKSTNSSGIETTSITTATNNNNNNNNESISNKIKMNGKFLNELLSDANLIEDDLDRLSFSSDDTVNLVKEANNYYLEDENEVENRRMLLTEKKYQSLETIEKLSSNPNLLKQPLITIKGLKKQKDRENDDESSFFFKNYTV